MFCLFLCEKGTEIVEATDNEHNLKKRKFKIFKPNGACWFYLVIISKRIMIARQDCDKTSYKYRIGVAENQVPE